MELFEILNGSSKKTNYFSDLLVEHFIKKEGSLYGDIENIKTQESNKAKQVYLLADYIEKEYVTLGSDVIGNIKDKDIEAFLGNIIFYQIDCFDIAKKLMIRYQKIQKEINGVTV